MCFFGLVDGVVVGEMVDEIVVDYFVFYVEFIDDFGKVEFDGIEVYVDMFGGVVVVVKDDVFVVVL